MRARYPDQQGYVNRNGVKLYWDVCGTSEETLDLCARVRCSVLVIHGDEDRFTPLHRAEALAAATGSALLTFAGSGHGPHARDPVKVNLAIAAFLASTARPDAGRRADPPGRRPDTG